MQYSTQKIIETLEDKGFSITENPEDPGTLICFKIGYREIMIREHNEGHLFKVLLGYTTKLDVALDKALLEDVA